MTSAQTGSGIFKTASTGSANRKLQFEFIFLGFLVCAITSCLDISLTRVIFAKPIPLVPQNQLELWGGAPAAGVNFFEVWLLSLVQPWSWSYTLSTTDIKNSLTLLPYPSNGSGDGLSYLELGTPLDIAIYKKSRLISFDKYYEILFADNNMALPLFDARFPPKI